MLIGKPNVGKTSFFISFAEFLGLQHCKISFRNFDGQVERRRYSTEMACKYLVSNTPYKTKGVQEMRLELPVYEGIKKMRFIDTVGLIDGDHPLPEIRNSMISALQSLNEVTTVLHIIDASAVEENLINSISNIDDQINEFGRMKGGYCILANKMDLHESSKGLECIRNKYNNTYIIPISTVSRLGFKEVKAYVARNI